MSLHTGSIFFNDNLPLSDLTALSTTFQKLMMHETGTEYGAAELKALVRYFSLFDNDTTVKRLRAQLRYYLRNDQLLAQMGDQPPEVQGAFAELQQLAFQSQGDTGEFANLETPEIPALPAKYPDTQIFVYHLYNLSRKESIRAEILAAAFAELNQALALGETALREWRTTFMDLEGKDISQIRSALFMELMPASESPKLAQALMIYWHVYHDHYWILKQVESAGDVAPEWKANIEHYLEALGILPDRTLDEITDSRISADSVNEIIDLLSQPLSAEERFLYARHLLRVYNHVMLDALEVLLKFAHEANSGSVALAVKPLIVSYLETFTLPREENPLFLHKTENTQLQAIFELILDNLHRLYPQDVTSAEKLRILLRSIIQTPDLMNSGSQLKEIFLQAVAGLRTPTSMLESRVLELNAFSPQEREG